MRLGWFTTAMLGLGALFTYRNGELEAAIVCGICFGVAAGMEWIKWVARRRKL